MKKHGVFFLLTLTTISLLGSEPKEGDQFVPAGDFFPIAEQRLLENSAITLSHVSSMIAESREVPVTANDGIGCFRFDFVTLTGRPGHEGLFPIPGQPIGKGPHTGLATLHGAYNSVQFKLVSQSGETLQLLEMEQGHPDAAADDFVGTFEIPDEPFSVVATGFVPPGFEFECAFYGVFEAQSVEVAPNLTDDTLRPGATTTVSFTVTNFSGTTDTFDIDASTGLGFVSDVSPTSLTLGSEPGSVQVQLTVPADTADGTRILLTVIATRTGDSSVSNSASVSLTVESRRSWPR